MAKLNKEEKFYRKELKAEVIRRNGFVAHAGRVTVACIPTFGANGKFATALCSESDEIKRKRGEMVAMLRLFRSGQPCVFPRYEIEIVEFMRAICHASVGYFVPADITISIGGPIEK